MNQIGFLNIQIGWETGLAKGSIKLVERVIGYIVVRWRRITVIACYISPNAAMWELEWFLQEIAEAEKWQEK